MLLCNVPFGDALGEVAHLVDGVEDFTEVAVLLTGNDAVQANVELLAVGRVGVSGMGFEGSLGGIHLGASESIFQN